ncbi:hypothetical protein H4R18_001716 [Coemansia javaensis]|uniref:Uncharacterized protein n=1 Tax=Coemansia javaensis TaxID=2761396 RepID=A0A9W8HE47_9FUNG|nr:hypothetical protein H4R18_001716 [Coemansia javaensis]
MGRVGEWMWDYVTERRPFVGITTRDRDTVEDALMEDWRQPRRPAGRAQANETETPRRYTRAGRQLTQRAYRRRLTWVLECWKLRNDKQIEREAATRVPPRRRPQTMRDEGTAAGDGRPDDGIVR